METGRSTRAGKVRSHPFHYAHGPLTPYGAAIVGAGRHVLHDRHWFLGSHGYVVRRRGAERLLREARPIEMHVDHYLCMQMHQRTVVGYVLPVSIVDQCLWRTEKAILRPHPVSHGARLNAAAL
jgi:hypothetical protein